MDFFKEFPSVLELFLNITELVAIIVSVFTFLFLMLNKYSKALKRILGPLGIGFGARLRVLFICRKSQIKKRAFIEYAILKTGGFPVINSEWQTIINAFKSFYSLYDESSLRYSIPNCTLLIEQEFSASTARYFEYFKRKKVKKAFGIQDDGICWVIQINIEEAYATPTCLLTGLLSQYDESWEEFIKRYVSTAYISESTENQAGSILSNELYFTFAWLLWGPSYELEYKNYWAGLCQLSYGDESNSVPAIADADEDIAERLKNKFLENEEHRYGALISADLSLYDKASYCKQLRASVNPANSYFYDKLENGDLSFLLKINNYSPCANYKAKKYYSTAYVWLLFELETDDYEFQPERSVAFFEHANLASRVTYQFLIDTLIDKSLKHFEDIFSDPQFDGRKYRYICAMNDKISSACLAKYNKIIESGSELGCKLRDRIIFEPKHKPDEVFAAYDDFFAPSNLVTFEEVKLERRDSVSDLALFYTEIYMESFPDENERETFDSLLGYLKKSETADAYRYHIILAKDGQGRTVGGCIFNYFKKSNSAVIEFLAVKSDLQSGGIGTAIYKHALSVLASDAYRMCRRPLDCVCCEIDSPEYSRAEIKKYLYFWDKNKYWHLKFNYVQPALSQNQEPVTGLWFTVSPQRASIKDISGSLVTDIVYDYIKYAMGISDPEKCKEFVNMKNELLAMGEVPLEKII